MISTFKNKKMVWVDLECPTAEEAKGLIQKYSIHPMIADELLKPTVRPRIDVHKDTIYLILHFPIYNHTKREYQSCEIDFILGKDFFITAHYRTIAPLIEMTKIFEADAMLKEDHLNKNSGVVLFHTLRSLYGCAEDQMDIIQKKIDDVSEKIFEKKSTLYDLVRKISHVRIEVLDFRRIIQFHKEIYSSLEFIALKTYGQDFTHYLNNINGEYLKLWNIIENHRETIESLQSTTDSLLSHRQNEVMKTLTIMAFVTFPLMLISAIFSMDTAFMPIVGMKGDFFIVIGIMIFATFLMFVFFKRKKWL